MNKRYHLIGIGGIGMSGIAHLLLKSGVKVSGSDVKESKITSELSLAGAQIFLGHKASNVQGANVVVFSSAIREDNPEIVEANKRGLKLIKRAQALAELMQEKTVITVAGSHGKTTTSSLVSFLLMGSGLSPTAAIGGILRNIDANACLGDGKFFVAEADESDGSFLYYKPNFSIITNIDHEHLDYYKDFEVEKSAFQEFINKTKDGGCVIACADDKNLRGLLQKSSLRHIFFGLDKMAADIYPENIQLKDLSSEFECFFKGKLVGKFYLSLGGLHNVSNALAVIALGLELGIDLECIKDALRSYKGAKRRLEIKFNNDDYLFIDDYAHHPTEIKATLSAVANLKRKRVVAIFQPHRYSRTKLLLDEFTKSFDQADCVIITDIYAASEDPIPGLSGRNIYDEIKRYAPKKEVYFIPKQEIPIFITENIKLGDLVITLGAGDIVRIGDELVERFTRQNCLK